MKTLSIILFVLATVSAIAGHYCCMACLSYMACDCWPDFFLDAEDAEDADEAVVLDAEMEEEADEALLSGD